RRVGVFLRAALDLGAPRREPLGPLVDERPRPRLERQVVQTDAIAVVRPLDLCGAQADGDARPVQVPDRLAALALHLGDPPVPERGEQLAVERQAALDRGDDEVDVVNARAGLHCARCYGFSGLPAVPSPNSCARPYRTARATRTGSCPASSSSCFSSPSAPTSGR